MSSNPTRCTGCFVVVRDHNTDTLTIEINMSVYIELNDVITERYVYIDVDVTRNDALYKNETRAITNEIMRYYKTHDLLIKQVK